MAEYIVTRDQGWPIANPKHPQMTVVEVDPETAQPDVDSGFLLPVDPTSPAFTEDMANAVVVYRKEKARLEAEAKKARRTEDAEAKKRDAEEKASAKKEEDAARENEKARQARVRAILDEVPVAPLSASSSTTTTTTAAPPPT